MSSLNQTTFFGRYARTILLLTLLIAPAVFYAAFRTVRSNTNKVADWLPASFRETDDLRWFRQHFTADQFVVISWEGCRLGDPPGTENAEADDPRIERLAQALAPESQDGQEVAASRYFKSVTTGRRVLNQLTMPPTSVPYAEAVERLNGSMIGPDGRQTCVVAFLSDEALLHLRQAIGRERKGPLGFGPSDGELFKAIRTCGIDPQQVHLGGPPVDNAAIDEEGERTLVRLAGLAALVGLVLAWRALRSVRMTLIVFACGLLSAAGGLGSVWLTGETSDAVLLSMPALVYVLAISGAIHLINYYQTALEESGPLGAAGKAIYRGARPALLCSITTSLGLLSLCTSDLTPIRKFGIYSAGAVMLTLAVLFLFLPAALEMWPSQPRSHKNQQVRKKGKKARKSREVPQFEIWQSFGGWIIRHHWWVTAACGVVIAAVGYGITRVETSINLMKLFDSDARILRDYRWLESNVGRLVPMEIVLRIDHEAIRDTSPARGGSAKNQGLTLLERMEIVSGINEAVDRRFGREGTAIIGPPSSALTFVPPLPEARQGTSTVLRRSITNSKLQQSYDALLGSDYLHVDPTDQAELWRISLRVAAFEDIDYGQFSSELQQLVDPLVADANLRIESQGKSFASLPLSTVYTGVVPIVYKAQRALLDSLIESTLWSFLTITPLLMFVSRGIRAGLVTMLPNVLPVLVIFGGMGWLGVPVDIGSMMSASIALGVAVDDTIHYLTWFRHDLDHTADRHSAILSAYRHCATPTLQAALINGLGLSVFAFSTFTPTKQFGFLMLTILVAGVVAELVMLPALLAGPLGKVFRPAGGKRGQVEPPHVVLPLIDQEQSVTPSTEALPATRKQIKCG